MAAVTKATLADRVLQHLGVLASGQNAAARDSALVEEAIDNLHDQLSAEGKAPFLTSAIPEWAQIPMRDLVSYQMAGTFGVTSQARLQMLAVGEQKARKDLARQLNSGPVPFTQGAEYY